MLERALGTMNFQLKQSLGREEITSASDTNVLTEKDVEVINEIMLIEKASLIADEVLKVVVEKMKEFKCEVPPTPNNLGKIYTEEMVNKVIKYVGRFNYNKALDDLLSNLSPNKENENNG